MANRAGGLFSGADEPPTAEGKKVQKWLYVFCFVSFVFSIIRLVTPHDIPSFTDIISCLLLMYGASSISYLIIPWYIILAFGPIVNGICMIGMHWQLGLPVFRTPYTVRNINILLSFVLYAVGKLRFANSQDSTSSSEPTRSSRQSREAFQRLKVC